MRHAALSTTVVVLLLAALSLPFLASPTEAASLSLRFAGQGIYPQVATANSQRWFRCELSWDIGTTDAGEDYGIVQNEHIIAVTLYNIGGRSFGFNSGLGYGGNLFRTLAWPGVSAPNNGTQYGVQVDSPDPNRRVLTVGPFAGHNSDYLVGWMQPGTIGGASPGTWDLSGNFRFHVRWAKWNNADDAKRYEEQTAIWVDGNYQTIPITPATGLGASGEVMYWYSSNGAGVDPLSVSPENPTDPDNGSGSDAYTLRVVYWNFIPNLIPTFRGVTARAMPGEGFGYSRFESHVISVLQGTVTPGAGTATGKSRHADGNYGHKFNNPFRDWGYGLGDGGKFDYYGSHQSNQQEGGSFEQYLSPQIISVLNREYNYPYYMLYERQAVTNGEVWKYEIMPTDYLQVFNNILQFPFDLPGSDAWDMHAELLRGRPASNNYVSLGPGGHRYEFLATRDWDPPVGQVTDDETGVTAYGKMMRCIAGRPGYRDYAATDLITGRAGATGIAARFISASSNDGFGYPYNSQDLTRYPKVNPVLAAWPASFRNISGTGAFAYPYNTSPSTVAPPFPGEPQGIEPWEDVVGPHTPGFVAPNRFTNDDTIMPNLVNMWGDLGPNGYDPDLRNASSFRAGKWTADTNFVFRINYFQSDNLEPKLATVMIRRVDEQGNPVTTWMPHAMRKVYVSDNDYTNGCLYFFEASASELPGGGGPGNYHYYFQFSDGIRTTIFPNRPSTIPPGLSFLNASDPGSIGVPPGNNDYYWFRVNSRPQLAGQSVNPPEANQGQPFVFRVTYQDQDGMVNSSNPLGDRPFKALLWIDLFGDPEGQAEITGVTAADSLTYNFASAPPGGGNIYPDGFLVAPPHKRPYRVYIQSGVALGKEYEIIANTAPGGDGTIQVQRVGGGAVDLAADGVQPGDLFQIQDWFSGTMDQENPADTNYRDGAVYVFDTARKGIVLDPGVHNYYFEFWDNWFYWFNWDQYFMLGDVTPQDGKFEGEKVRLPQQGFFVGPIVHTNREPSLSRFYFAPPTPDSVDSLESGTVLNYVRPQPRPGYSAGTLAGKFLHVVSGPAAGKVYPIQNNTATDITITGGDLEADGVGPADGFRIFEHWDLTNGLSYAYHVPGEVDGVEADTFTLFVTYRDPDNDVPTSIRLGVYYGAPPASATQVPNRILDVVKVDPANNDYVGGVEYRCSSPISLPIGQNYFRGQATDGALWHGSGNAAQWHGPVGYLTHNPPAPLIGAEPPPDTIPPPLVQPLIVTSGPDGTSLILDWSGWVPPAKPDDVRGYNIWIETADFTDTTPLTPKATLDVPPDHTGYTWTEAIPGTTYYVCVTAFDAVPNEIKTPVTTVSVTATDTQGPEVSERTPADGATNIPRETPVTISCKLTDGSGVDLTTVELRVNGVLVTPTLTPNTGQPKTLTVSYQTTFTWADADTVNVEIRASDIWSNDTVDNWSFTLVIDDEAPTVTNLDPPNNAAGVPPTDPISFRVRDNRSGVDVTTLRFEVDGVDRTGELDVNSTNLLNVICTWTPPLPGLPASSTPVIKIDATDRAGNVMTQFVWSFTTLHAIYGRVTLEDGTTGLAGVTVTNGEVNAVTDADGNYALLGVSDGEYVVTPAKVHYRFDPATRNVPVSGDSVTGINFTAIPETYSIRGVIRDHAGNPIAGVQVSDGVNPAVTTDSAGRYTLSGLQVGAYTVTPTSATWRFVPTSRNVTVPTTDSIDFTGYRFYQHPGGTLPTGIYMLGVPFDPADRNPVNLFGTNLVRRWNPLITPPGYQGPGDPGSTALLEVRPGRGYFVKLTTPTAIEGSGVPVSTATPHVISLGPEWNMIANPYPVSMPLANLTPALPGGTTSYVFVYDTATGSYLFLSPTAGVNVARTFLQPWEGAWIRSLAGVTSVSTSAPPGAASAEEVKPQALDVGPAGYVFPLVAEAAGRADLCSAAGVSTQGRYAVHNPPTAPQSVDLYFVDEAGNKLAQLVQPASATGAHTWNFVVTTDLADTEVAVRLPDLSQVPRDLGITLVDEATGRSVYMRTSSQYVFRSGEQGAARQFRLEIGPQGGNTLAITAASAQPVAAGAVISYSVSQACQVQVEVRNIAGRTIRRVNTGPVASGVNAFTWNLRSDQGAAVPNGMYLVQIRAVAENGQTVQALTHVNVNR